MAFAKTMVRPALLLFEQGQLLLDKFSPKLVLQRAPGVRFQQEY